MVIGGRVEDGGRVHPGLKEIEIGLSCKVEGNTVTYN